MSNDQTTDQKESHLQRDDQPDDQLIRLVMEEQRKARWQRNLKAIKAWEAVEFAVKDGFAASNGGDYL